MLVGSTLGGGGGGSTALGRVDADRASGAASDTEGWSVSTVSGNVFDRVDVDEFACDLQEPRVCERLRENINSIGNLYSAA